MNPWVVVRKVVGGGVRVLNRAGSGGRRGCGGSCVGGLIH